MSIIRLPWRILSIMVTTAMGITVMVIMAPAPTSNPPQTTADRSLSTIMLV
jgi:hypothetical protein